MTDDQVLDKKTILAQARPKEESEPIVVEGSPDMGKLSMRYSEWAKMAESMPVNDFAGMPDEEKPESLFVIVIGLIEDSADAEEIKRGDHWIVYDPKRNRVDVKRRGKRNEHRPKRKKRRR